MSSNPPSPQTDSKTIKNKWPTYRICMLGELGCGKTTLFKKFAALSKTSTIQDNTVTLSYEYCNTKYDLRILDCYGKLDATPDGTLWKWVADSDLFIFVYDLTNMTSFERIIDFHKFATKVKKVTDIPMVVVANKKDRESERKVNTQLGQRVANNVSSHYTPPNNNNKEVNNSRTNKHSFLEVSANSGNGDEKQILDFAVIEAVKYVGTGVPHKFEMKYFKGPTWCKHCGNFIFGVVYKQGYWCKDCKYTAHRKCIKLVPNNCGSTIQTKSEEEEDPHHSVRIEELLTDENLAETLNDEATRKKFTLFVSSETPQEVIKQLDLWVEVEEYHKLTSKEDRKAKGQTIAQKFFTNNDALKDLRLESDVVTKLKQKLTSGNFEVDMFDSAQQGVFKQMELQVFPKFLSQEFHKCLSGEIQVAEIPPEDVVEEVAEEEESYSSGTFVAKDVDEDVVSEAIKDLNIKEAEQWEKNILALEKGEFVEEMNPKAFKKYVKTRGRLPSMMIRAASENSVLTPQAIVQGMQDEINRNRERQIKRSFASKPIDKSI